MSQLPATPAGSKSLLDIQARTAEVATTLGALPKVAAEALRVAAFDLVNHQRTTVLSRHRLPSRTRGRRMLASLLHRYSRASMDASRPMDISAESFGAAKTPRYLENLERGATITTNEAMAIPIDAGVTQLGGERITHANFRKFLAQRRLDIVPTRRGALLVHTAEATRRKGESIGLRSVVYGILLKKRTQRPLLGFYAAYDAVLPRHLAKMDKILDLALTESGRMQLARRMDASRAGTAAYYAEQARLLTANGGKMSSDIRKAARAAAKAAERESLARSSGGAA